MDEIRFSDSIAKVEEQYRRWLKYPFLTLSTCDGCRRWGQGVFRVHLGDFRCLKCLARDYFEDLVGKPQQSDQLLDIEMSHIERVRNG